MKALELDDVLISYADLRFLSTQLQKPTLMHLRDFACLITKEQNYRTQLFLVLLELFSTNCHPMTASVNLRSQVQIIFIAKLLSNHALVHLKLYDGELTLPQNFPRL